jgi:hypothetical protein
MKNIIIGFFLFFISTACMADHCEQYPAACAGIKDAAIAPATPVEQAVGNIFAFIGGNNSSAATDFAYKSSNSGSSSGGSGPDTSKTETSQPNEEAYKPTTTGQIVNSAYERSNLTNSYSPGLGDSYTSWDFSFSATSMKLGNIPEADIVKTESGFDLKNPTLNPSIGFMDISLQGKINANDFSVRGVSIAYAPGISTPGGDIFRPVEVSVGTDFIGVPNVQASLRVFDFKASATVTPGAGTYNAAGELSRAINSLYNVCAPSIGACD